MGHHRHEAARIPNPKVKRGKPKSKQKSKVDWVKGWGNLFRIKTKWAGPQNDVAMNGTKSGRKELKAIELESPGFLKRLMGKS